MTPTRPATIGDVTSVVTKGTTPTTLGRNFTSEGVGFIKAESLSIDGRIITNKLAYIDEETHQLLKRSRLHQGDVLFSIAGVIGRTALIQRNALPANTNQAIAILRPDTDRITPRFLYYSVRSKGFQDHSLGHVVQTAQANVSLSVLSATPIWVPALPVQLLIGDMLSAYDELIENSQRRILILEEMARALYREWFVHFRFPGHENYAGVSSTLGEIPAGWEVRKVGEVLELNYGKALKKADRREGTCPVYGSSGVVGSHDECLTQGPGIVVGRKGNVGSVYWCDEDFFVIDTAYYVTSPLPLRFLYYVLPTLNFINSDAAVPGLSRQQAYSLNVLVPPASLLAEFCELAEVFEQQASTLNTQVQNLRRTRDLILPRLLSGQLQLDIV